jgi:hypothetical protein
MQSNASKSIAQQPGQPAQQPQALTVRTVDRPECQEIFADSVSGLYFDGQTLRLELSVTRFDEVKPNTPVTARRYPACRVVLSPAAALELINRTQQIGAALKQANTAQARPTEDQNKSSGPARDNDASIM